MYIVIEIQTSTSGAVGNFVFAYEDLADARAKFYALCSIAVKSELPVHAVVLLTNSGTMVASEYFRHGDEPETAI